MLTVYRSNRAELLAQLLAARLRLSPPGPFEPVQVVVNTWPTSRWLGEQLALGLGSGAGAFADGIAANLRFPFPGSHLRQLVEAHSHCLVVADGSWVVGLVTLPDLQRALSAEPRRNEGGKALMPSVIACRRSDLVWLPLSAHLAQLEDQLTPNGLRQVPVFDVPAATAAALPHGLPNPGLPVVSLQGLATRDGMARALARQLHRLG